MNALLDSQGVWEVSEKSCDEPLEEYSLSQIEKVLEKTSKKRMNKLSPSSINLWMILCLRKVVNATRVLV
jgi:hypothetical protein